MKTNFKLTLATIIGFVAGGVAGFFFQSAITTADSAKGDIAKVSKFSRNVVSPTMSAFQEKITSDSDELKKATASLTVLTSRMTEFDELVNIAAAASEGNEELASSLKDLLSVKRLAANARTSGTQALEAINAIAEGKKSSVDYEQASQNLALAFMMVDRQVSVGKQYVCDVDAFLRGKNVEDYKDLALARDLWAGYCAGEAVLNSDKEELEYWRNQQNLLSEGTATLSMSYDFAPLQECFTIDAILGLTGPFMKITNRGTLEVTAEGAQSIVMNNQESFKVLENVDDIRSMLNLSSGPMTELGPEQLMRNSVPAMEAVLLKAFDGAMPATREHLLK